MGGLSKKSLSSGLQSVIDGKADGETVTSLTTRVEQTEEEIALKASSETVNALGERVASAETSIVQNANSITSKASQSDVNALGERVTTAESEIRQTPDRISAAVSAVQVGGTNLVTLGNQSITNASGSTAVYLGKDWYRASEHQTTVSPYSGVCWYLR